MDADTHVVVTHEGTLVALTICFIKVSPESYAIFDQLANVFIFALNVSHGKNVAVVPAPLVCSCVFNVLSIFFINAIDLCIVGVTVHASIFIFSVS